MVNPLLNILTPGTTAPAAVGGAVNALGAAGTAAAGSTANALGQVQVDSSSFLNILANTSTANGTAPDFILDIQNAAAGKNLQNLPASVKAAYEQLLQNTPQNPNAQAPQINQTQNLSNNTLLNNENVKAVLPQELLNTNSVPQNGSGVDAATSTTPTLNGSIKTVADNIVGDERGTSQATVAPAQSQGKGTAEQPNNALLQAQTQQQAVNTKSAVAEPSPAAASEASKAAPVTPQIVRADGEAIRTNTYDNKKPGVLSNSAKLLDQLEGNVRQVAIPKNSTEQDPEVVTSKEKLNLAVKAYDKDASVQELSKAGVRAAAAEVITTESRVASTADLNTNNLSIDSLRQLNSSSSTVVNNLKPAPQPSFAPPAEQASIKIANAINEGVRHITIELEPAKLGQMEVKMELAKEGTSKLIVYVERTETLNMIRNDSAILERVLQDAGFKTDSGSLSFNLKGGDDFLANGQQNAGSDNSGKSQSDDNQVAQNDNYNPSLEYRMDLSNGVVDITV